MHATATSHNTPKYDMLRNPVYLVDFQALSSGKRLGLTKRRIRWRFGFANREAIENGFAGTNCRGEEHEVTMVWSLVSGKRLVLADSQEVHFSMGRHTDTRFETTWSMFGNHIFKIVAYATHPISPRPGFHQFDLILDGRSIFDMPKIYELGVNQLPYRASRAYEGAFNSYSFPSPRGEVSPWDDTTRDHERNRLMDMEKSAPILAVGSDSVSDIHSSPERPRSIPVLTNFPDGDLISDPSPVITSQNWLEFPVPQASSSSLETHDIVLQDEFAPRSIAPIAGSTSNQVSHHIMSTYKSPAPLKPRPKLLDLGLFPHDQGVAVVTPPSHARTTHVVNPEMQSMSYPSLDFSFPDPVSPGRTPLGTGTPIQTSQVPTPFDTHQHVSTPTFSMEYNQHASTSTFLTREAASTPEPTYAVPVTEMEKALKNLVNIDNITMGVQLEEEYKLTMEKKPKQKIVRRKDKTRSQPLPPVEHSWSLGQTPSLNAIKAQVGPRETNNKKEIMRTHLFDGNHAAAGALVVHGQPSSQMMGGGSSFGAGVPYYHQ